MKSGYPVNLKFIIFGLSDQVNHNSSITLEDPSWEIKGKGLFSRELVFSLWTPVSVKAGEQVNSFLKISPVSVGDVYILY